MKKVFLVFFLSLLLVGSFGLSLADNGNGNGNGNGTGESQGLVPCSMIETENGKPKCELCHIFVLIDNLIKFFLIPSSFNGGLPVVPAVAILMIVIGGFMYIVGYTSSPEALVGGGKGGPKLISQARRLFGAVAIGLLIAYGAWLIIDLFFSTVGLKDGFGFWNEISCE